MNTVDALKTKYSKLTSEELIDKIIDLHAKLAQLQHLFFSSKKERWAPDPDGQRSLFDEPEQTVEDASYGKDDINSETTIVEKHTRKRGKRKPLSSLLPRRREEIDLPEEEKICKVHNTPLERIGFDTSEKLEIVPAKLTVLERAVAKYKCPCCANEDKIDIVQAQAPRDLIPKSFATPSLLAYITVSKYEDALPLYRQEKIFLRVGIELGRATMSRWIIRASQECQPLLNLMKEDLLDNDVVHVDETEVQVLKEKDRKPEQKSYMWCMAKSGVQPIVFFNYYDNRSKKAASDLLDNYKGTIVCDGYKVYDSMQRMLRFVLAGCFAHCRRKFWMAEKSTKKLVKAKNKPLASTALGYIRELYKIERSIKDESPEKKLLARQTHSRPILDKFKEWLDEKSQTVVPKSLTGKAISYALNQWDKLIIFSANGNVPIDNNYMESHIRPFVIGRNNWLFSAGAAGAHSSAGLYSLVETAKANQLSPYSYLNLIFKELPNARTQEDFERLLPYNASKHFEIERYKPPG